CQNMVGTASARIHRPSDPGSAEIRRGAGRYGFVSAEREPMSVAVEPIPEGASLTALDRALRPFGDVHAGEGVTTILMLVNIFLILICYSVIKTVREPLILLGGGAEIRSYAAAGQAILLMGFVPFYSWFASRVDRARLLVGVSLFFIACIELFASALAARVPYVGVAFFIWVGIFNMSLVAQFWSFA